MNLMLFEGEELDAQNQLCIRDRRLSHLRSVLNLQIGDALRLGEIGGQLGEGRILSLDARQALIAVQTDQAPPRPLPVTLVLALPRPKMLRRILRGIAETGVKDLHLINSYRVEKSYWQSPLLQPHALREALLAGLEQAMDTVLPTVHLQQRFRPFAEDVLPGLCRDKQALLADARARAPYPSTPGEPALVIIGPEGGFISFETGLLQAAGAQSVGLGSRVLRVETALHCALGRHLQTR